MRKDTPVPGRPRTARVTKAIEQASLQELAEAGYTHATIASIAQRAKTSKQAIYRRWPDKETMIAEALRQALAALPPHPPERSNVAADLFAYLTGITEALELSALGGALRSVLPLAATIPVIGDVLVEMEDAWRLTLRQILIATPFEAALETRIDLLLGLLLSHGLLQYRTISREKIAEAIELVLGLRAPRASPSSSTGTD